MPRFISYPYILLLLLATQTGSAQNGQIEGYLTSGSEPLAFASVAIPELSIGTVADENGYFKINKLPEGEMEVKAYLLGYQPRYKTLNLAPDQKVHLDLELSPIPGMLDEVVVTGTMKAVSRMESAVPVEVYTPAFFQRNPTPNVFEALQNVNGVRPQLNCQVCNTGDIHINGLEGPYTMVLIDGMPIVSSLSTVYGLSGIPNSMIERMEVVKGPASSLYGSEAIGGLINIITVHPDRADKISADFMATSWEEYNLDIGASTSLGKKASGLTGINLFHFDRITDNNGDNFTDVALQKRISVFQKIEFNRKGDRAFNLAGRYYYEDRWGGELQWKKENRGGDEVYGESIYTNRWEFMGNYELPTPQKMMVSFSYNDHQQNSVYGDVPYLAHQRIGFVQITWDHSHGRHDLLAGTAARYNWYDDNTPATGGTADDPGNNPDDFWLPGVFVQDEISLGNRHKVLAGLRYDYNQNHGNIITPRLAFKLSFPEGSIFRVNAGTGFRVVNLFTEDHAALTGAREVVIAEALKPERSYNVNINYLKKICKENGLGLIIEASAWHTWFTNLILPDYETDPNKIIYDNLDGSAISRGASLNIDLSIPSGFNFSVGMSAMDVFSNENGVRTRQILTERYTGTWSVGYSFSKTPLKIDYTGNLYGPMRLPLLGPLDPRAPESPVWSIQNIQLTFKKGKGMEFYGGVKNLLNWTPNEGNPFIIARAHDPFDRDVTFDGDGNALSTPDNPYALTFDPSYVYGPNQGIRAFLGIRYAIR